MVRITSTTLGMEIRLLYCYDTSPPVHPNGERGCQIGVAIRKRSLESSEVSLREHLLDDFHVVNSRSDPQQTLGSASGSLEKLAGVGLEEVAASPEVGDDPVSLRALRINLIPDEPPGAMGHSVKDNSKG